MSLLPMAGQDTIPRDAALVRIQNPPAKSDDWKKVTTSNMDAAPADATSADALDDEHPSTVKHAMTVPPYSQYRNANNKPRVQHGQMPAPSAVYDKHHHCLPMPMLPVYRDADEACIVLGMTLSSLTSSTIPEKVS
jgi:hypothetical protein